MDEKKPNLIYVFADQLRYSALGCNGSASAHTPNIDTLAAECTVMDNAVSGHPVCSPYRATLLTGEYTTGGTGMVINELRLDPQRRCLAHMLSDGGYDAEYIGKWHMYAARLGHHYDVENSFIPKGPDRLGFDGYFAAYNFHHEYYAPKAYYHLDTPEKLYCKKYEPDEQTDMAIERIRLHKDAKRPLALFLSYGTPHDPWTRGNVPEEYYELFRDTEFPLPPNYVAKNDPHADGWARFAPGKRARLSEWQRVYAAMVANLDWNIGRLLEAIRAEGMEQNTVFVFTSDHGELFGAHGRHAKNIFYEEAVRVPFMIKWGDRLPRMRNRTGMNTVDILPTLLGLLGLPAEKGAQGTDLSGCILSGVERENPCLLMGTGPTAMFGDGKEWRGLRTERFTYAVYLSDGREYLFDNLADPYQLSDLAQDPVHAHTREELKTKMLEMMEAVGDGFEKNSYYKKHWVKNRRILPREGRI